MAQNYQKFKEFVEYQPSVSGHWKEVQICQGVEKLPESISHISIIEFLKIELPSV